MDTGTARTPAPRRAAFEDGLGKRYHAVGPGGEPLEVLELRDEFTTAALFESALRERVTALAGFQNTCFSRVRSVQRLRQMASKLVVVSDRVSGARLSTILAAARQQQLPLEVNAALSLVRQLVSAIGMLHEKLPAVAHGAIAPERIVITPNARLVVVDHMLGSALEQLRFSHDRYWKELRVPLPPATQPIFDQRADVMQIGMIALALILGRPIDLEEYPDRIEDLAERACGLIATSGAQPLSEFRAWLWRMLQLDTAQAFWSAGDAWADLERALGASDNVASFGALESFMAEYARRTTAGTALTTPSTAGPTPIASTPPVTAPSMTLPSAAPAAASPAVTPSGPTIASSPATASPALPPATIEPPATPSRPVAPPPMFRAFAAPAAAISAEPEANVAKAKPRRRRRWLAAAAALILLASGGALFGRQFLNLMAPAAAEAPGTLAVITNPAGVPVIVDGQPRGVTPLTLELAAGSHELKLAADGEPRIIPFTITPGSTVSQTIELPKAGPRTGQLMVRTEPSGARITIDGTPVGTTPLTLAGLAPGTHTVALATDLSSVTEDVTIEAGTTASLVVPMTTPQGVPISGWISVVAPAEVQVYEDTRLLGTSQSDRIMVSAGRHELDIVNNALGYAATRSVAVSPGKVSVIRVDWPTGSIALNAQPWAEVWIDGDKVGETPIGRIAVPIGTHEVVFRHPQLGEKVVRATVTAATPARVSVDMSKR